MAPDFCAVETVVVMVDGVVPVRVHDGVAVPVRAGRV